MIKEISLDNKEYFELSIGKRVLKKDVFNVDKGVPVYSSNVYKPFGYLDSSNISDFNYSYVIWGIDGYFHLNVMPKGTVFAITDHCGAIEILTEDIIPEYLMYQLELKKHELGFDRTLRASLGNMEKVTVQIPFNENGSIDKEVQQEIVKKYMFITKIQRELGDSLDEIDSSKIELEIEGDFKRVALKKIMDFPPTNIGVTKSFCIDNKGSIPVYGCSKIKTSKLGSIRNNIEGIKYYEHCLTWNRNGSVGYVFFREELFSINEDHRVMEIKMQYKNQLDCVYLKNVIQNEIQKLGFGYSNKLGKDRMKEVEIPIPVDNNQYDFERQQEIASKYETVNMIKKQIIDEIENFLQFSVQLL